MPDDRRPSDRPDDQAPIPPSKEHATRILFTARAGINFRKSGTIDAYSPARPGHRLPAKAKDNPAGMKIIHPLQPWRAAPRSRSVGNIRRKWLRQGAKRDGTQNQEELVHEHIPFPA